MCSKTAYYTEQKEISNVLLFYKRRTSLLNKLYIYISGRVIKFLFSFSYSECKTDRISYAKATLTFEQYSFYALYCLSYSVLEMLLFSRTLLPFVPIILHVQTKQERQTTQKRDRSLDMQRWGDILCDNFFLAAQLDSSHITEEQ